MGCAVLFDMRLLMVTSASPGRETEKRVLMALLVTVMSCGCSGSADEKAHSDSSCAGGAAAGAVPLAGPMPNRSAAGVACAGGGAGVGALADCWNWKGDAERDVPASAAKGSDFVGWWCGAVCCAKMDGTGVAGLDGGLEEPVMEAKGS